MRARCSRLSRCLTRLLLPALLLSAGGLRMVHAEEVHTNGTGGGLWSDPATWRTKSVPKPTDDAVISRGDVVVFDRNDDGRISCHQLFIDPRGSLVFKTGSGKQIFCAGGPIEAFGAIKLDASRSASDLLELRMVAAAANQRVVKLLKGGALLVVGRDHLPEGRRNAIVTSLPPVPKPTADAPAPPPGDPTGVVDATAGSSLDLRRAGLINILLKGTTIDNTGARPNERVNIVDNHFTGMSRLNLTSCDTPLVANNLCEFAGPGQLGEAALYIYACPLAEIRGNTIRGRYVTGITGYAQIDSSAVQNTIEGCATGLYWYGSNAMIKQLVLKNCDTGIVITSMSGALEDILFDNCPTGLNHAGATAQVTSMRSVNAPKDAVPVLYVSGPLTLLNCNISHEQIKFNDRKPTVQVGDTPRPPQIVSMQFVVVGVNGPVPDGATVELRTTNPMPPLPPGAADLNVRNSPARILKTGLTPLPQTLEPLIVKSWMVDADARFVAAPAYTLNLLGPVASAGERKLLKSTMITPADAWCREEPNAKTPTVEVTLP